MKAAVFRNLNDIVSLTVLTLMAVALVAGQSSLPPDTAGGDEVELQMTSIRHHGE